MKLSLSAKWFLWLISAITVFSLGQLLAMVLLEVVELRKGEASLAEEVAEIATLLSVSVSVFVLLLGGLWFVSRRMIRPIRSIAESARRISEGNLEERVEGDFAEDEVGMLVSTINTAFDRYHETLRRLDRFSGNAAHQLRTPLTSIRSLGEVCLLKDRSASEYRECINSMLEVVQELTSVVDKVLMIARLNPSRVGQLFGSVRVDEVLSQVLTLYDGMFQEKNIELKRQHCAHVNVVGERSLIGQAIGNIIDNAVRFTPEGGTVVVSIQERDKSVVLRVTDTGPGIPESMLLHISEDGNAEWNGELPTGRMGLAIVSEILRIHNGTVDIRRADGGGTCVELVWPRP